MKTNTNLSLEQKSFWEGRQTFVLEEKSLQVTIKGKAMLKEDQIDLYIFDPEPSRYRNVEYGLLVFVPICLVFGIMSILAIIETYGVSEDVIFGIIMLLLSLCCMALVLRQFVIKSRDMLIFYNRFNGEPVLYLWNNNPNPKDFQEFTTKLKERIKASVESYDSKNNISIASKIQELNDLKEKGIISQVEFDTAKLKILGSVGELDEMYR